VVSVALKGCFIEDAGSPIYFADIVIAAFETGGSSAFLFKRAME
jgi:hypothetical protein